MFISIMFGQGLVYTLHVDSEWKCATLITHLRNKFILSANFKLFFDAIEMQPEKKLQDYNIYQYAWLQAKY